MSAAELRLSTTVRFGLKMTISNIFLSALSDFQNRSPFHYTTGFTPCWLHFLFFFQVLEFRALHQEYCSALSLGRDAY